MKTEIVNWLTNLNTDKSNPWPDKVTNQAPHKPILLLSILDGIEEGQIRENKIYLTQQLVDTFFTYWKGLMGDERMTTIALPFYHMSSEEFWDLQYNDGEAKFTFSPSLGALKKRVTYAVINPELFELMNTKHGRDTIRSLIIQTYFSGEGKTQVLEIGSMNRQAAEYAVELRKMAKNEFRKIHDKEGKHREITRNEQVRDKGFRKVVKENYDFCCAVCKNRVITPSEEVLVVGAHIIPWAVSYNDDPRNGISLCRNHHWMFDHMLLAIRKDYSVKISKWLSQSENVYSGIESIKNVEIMLPKDESYFPAAEALSYHYERFSSFQKEI